MNFVLLFNKVAFFESLNLFAIKCHSKFVDANEKSADDTLFLKDLTQLFETIYIYLYRHLRSTSSSKTNENDPMLSETHENMSLNLDDSITTNPIQSLFDSFEFRSLTNSPTPITSYLFSLLDEFHTLKYILMTWAYLKGSNQDAASKLTKLVESFFSQFILFNKSMCTEFSGLEYMLNRDALANSILSIMLREAALEGKTIGPNKPPNYSPSILKLAFCLKTIEVFDSLLYNFEIITAHDSSNSQV